MKFEAHIKAKSTYYPKLLVNDYTAVRYTALAALTAIPVTQYP